MAAPLQGNHTGLPLRWRCCRLVQDHDQERILSRAWPPFDPGAPWQRNYYQHVIRTDDDLNPPHVRDLSPRALLERLG